VNDIAFIGDIHGHVEPLVNLLGKVVPQTDKLVFLGDYINRGPNSKAVISTLIELSTRNDLDCTFLLGNHEEALLRALDTRAIDPFLRIGGASTILSYLDQAEGDVASSFFQSFPPEHWSFLKKLVRVFRTSDLMATHDPKSPGVEEIPDDVFRIHGHIPQLGRIPVIEGSTAFIDTGCGTIEGAPLSCLFWPSLTWLQSDL